MISNCVIGVMPWNEFYKIFVSIITSSVCSIWRKWKIRTWNGMMLTLVASSTNIEIVAINLFNKVTT